MKTKFKLLFLILGTLTIFFACQKDDNFTDSLELQNQLKKPPSFTATIYNGDSILNANPNLKIRLKNMIKNKTSLRTMQSSEYDFSIDTTRVQQIQTSSYISYTFTVERPYPVDDVLENYVITYFNNSTYRQYLIEYPILNNNGNLSYDVSNAQITILDDENLMYHRDDCVSVMVFEEPVCVDIPCQGGENHTFEQGNECYYWGGVKSATRECTEGGYIDPGCSDGGNEGNDDSEGETSGNDTGGTGTNGPGTTDEPEPEDEIVIPLGPALIQQIENCINRPPMIGVPDDTTITPGLIAGLNFSIQEIRALNDYLRTQNNCSEQAQAEIIAMIEMIIEMDKECQARVLVSSILSVNTTFTSLIKNYFLLSDNSNLMIEDLESGNGVNQIPNNVGARVYPTLSFDPINQGDVVVMRFNNSYLDTASNLGFVNTFYHELIHAYILDLYYKEQLLTIYPNYTSLNTAISNYLYDIDNVTLAGVYNQEMHNIYIDFIDLLAESLYEYCLQNNIDGVDLSYATKLVWGGLNGYEIFNNNLTPTQRLEAQTLLGYENFNHTGYAKGPKTCN